MKRYKFSSGNHFLSLSDSKFHFLAVDCCPDRASISASGLLVPTIWMLGQSRPLADKCLILFFREILFHELFCFYVCLTSRSMFVHENCQQITESPQRLWLFAYICYLKFSQTFPCHSHYMGYLVVVLLRGDCRNITFPLRLTGLNMSTLNLVS